MEILSHKNRRELLDFLPHIKSSPQEWQLVEIRMTGDSSVGLVIAKVAELVHSLFKDKEGKLYICNDHEVLMLLRWGKDRPSSEIIQSIEKHLPQGSCKVFVHEPTPEGLSKLEILITYKKPDDIAASFTDIRSTRRENVILAADDDMYIRLLVKKALNPKDSVHEVADANDILTAYKQYVPDVVFLDIHMPGKDGTEVLHDILTIDPEAYIIMLSADSSVEKVGYTMHEGAKGFVTKPFTKEKLQKYIAKCPTIS